MKMKLLAIFLILFFCFGCLATVPEQTQSIIDHNASNSEMRRATLDSVFAMLQQSYGTDRKLLEVKTPEGLNTLTVYRYDNNGIEHVCQMVMSLVKDSDFIKFPDHPLVGFAKEIKELGLGVVNSPAAALVAGGFAARWLAESVGDSSGHNTNMTAGGHIAGGNVEIPTTTTTTETITTETISGSTTAPIE